MVIILVSSIFNITYTSRLFLQFQVDLVASKQNSCLRGAAVTAATKWDQQVTLQHLLQVSRIIPRFSTQKCSITDCFGSVLLLAEWEPRDVDYDRSYGSLRNALP